MLDIKFVRENPELVKENIKKKFQDEKLPLVDEVVELDARQRAAITEASELRAQRNALSKQVGALMGQAKKDPSKLAEAEAIKAQVKAQADRLAELEAQEAELEEKVRAIMLRIPQMIDPSVPIGPDDSHNVEVQRFGEPKVPDFEIPYHTEIMESFGGIDLDSARRVAGNGFYYLVGDIARLHEAVLARAREGKLIVMTAGAERGQRPRRLRHRTRAERRPADTGGLRHDHRGRGHQAHVAAAAREVPGRGRQAVLHSGQQGHTHGEDVKAICTNRPVVVASCISFASG